MLPRFDDRRLLLILALAAFAIRILFLANFTGSPLFVPVSGGNDCWLYYSIAQRCAEGTWIPEGVFQYMPLYAWILGGIALVAGTKTLLVAALIGSVLDTATVILIFKFARRCGAPQIAAFLGALLFATYPLAITYSALNMPNTMNAFFVLLFAFIVHGFTRETPLWKWVAVGLFAGVVCLSFAGMLLISIVTAVWFLVVFVLRSPPACPARVRASGEVPPHGGATKRFSQFGKVIAFLAAVALPIVPVSLHNYRAEGQFVLITAHGGFNFWLGNNEDATGYTILPKGFRGDRGNLLYDAMVDAEKREGRKLKAAEFAKHWKDRAKKFIRENPGQEARLLGQKFLNFWNATEYDDLRMLPMLRLTETAFTWPVWPGFGIISVFGFAGLLTARRCGLLRVITAVSMLSIVSFFITSRYRLTVCPLLCVLAAVGATPLLDAVRARLGLWLAALIAAILLARWPIKGTDYRALDCYNTATHLMEKAKQTGDGSLVEDAFRYATKGIEYDPAAYDLHFIAGNALFGLGHTNEAIRAYANTIKLNPRHAQAFFNLGVVANLGGDRAAALSNITHAVELDPAFEQAKEFLKTLTNDSAAKQP